MKQSFTTNHLIQFIYKETSPIDNLAITKALSEDLELREEYNHLYGAYLQLPKVKFNVSSSVIQNILLHSKRLECEQKV